MVREKYLTSDVISKYINIGYEDNGHYFLLVSNGLISVNKFFFDVWKLINNIDSISEIAANIKCMEDYKLHDDDVIIKKIMSVIEILESYGAVTAKWKSFVSSGRREI